MPFVARVTAHPDVGGFQPTSFRELLGKHIRLPGLAEPSTGWRHTLVDVSVADDGSSAELTVHSEPHAAISLDRNLQIVTPMPNARIKAHDRDGGLLAESSLPAPLYPGQLVQFSDNTRWRVVEEPTWPHRDPVSGACAGAIDWQHVVLQPEPAPSTHPTEATE
ncbi:MAG TPA: hypothetical protein VGJ13_05305 [Pseudonocardiaceae bacterium]